MPDETSTETSQNWFASTLWTVVRCAGDAESPEARAALEQLCRAYWQPLHHFARARGCPQEDAEDLTQGFFAALLARGSLRLADPARGRFRSFLLTAFKHHLADAHDRAMAQRRGGGAAHVPLDNVPALAAESAGPEREFDREWARALVARATESLRAEFSAAGTGGLFALLSDGDAGGYAEIAARLETTEEAIKSAAKRLRQRYRELLEFEIAQTVATPEDAREEMRYLAELLRA